MSNKLIKVNISEESSAKLKSMMENLKEENTTIKINKQKLTSWIIIQFEKKQFIKSKEQIQKDHFDQLKHLQDTLKKLKKSQGNEKEELKTYLQAILGKKSQPKQNLITEV
jgi:monomeric isocitrate dehydrogenase